MSAISWNAGFSLEQFENIKMNKRDRLISLLLQDRGSLRLISAPHGFGKSFLAYEYAQRMFSMGNVLWLSADAPEFISNLDRGYLIPLNERDREPFDLVILDDIPFLDEERVQALSSQIDALLMDGTEVIATAIPSHDNLRHAQPDRTLIGAEDMLVSETECKAGVLIRIDAKDAVSQARKTWLESCTMLFGRAPAVVWGDKSLSVASCLKGFFSEQLSLDVFKAAFSMLLLGQGNFEDVRHLGVSVRTETENLLIADYPFLGIDPVQRTFNVGSFDMDDLRAAVASSSFAYALTEGEYPLPERIAGAVLARKDAQRMGTILNAFSTDERCGLWLESKGWELLDRGEASWVSSLLDRCECWAPLSPRLMVLRAWTLGLSGEGKMATRCAENGMRRASLDAGEGTNEAALMGYLALILFDGGVPAPCPKGRFAGEELVTEVDFLACVVDLCSEIELGRAMSTCFPMRTPEFEPHRADADPQRAAALEALFTSCYDRFGGTLAYRFALHFLGHVDSFELHGVFQGLGCFTALEARRESECSFTQSLVVLDLWKTGYFGVSRGAVDMRDMRVLDNAAAQLGKMGRMVSGEPLPIPWETNALTGSSEEKDVSDGKLLQVPSPVVKERVPPQVMVNLFGGFEVMVGDDYQSEADWRPKAVSLFALLTIFKGRDITKDFIFDQLWPKSSRVRAQDNLYNLWSQIQAKLGNGPYLVKRGEFCRINPRYVSSDVAEFEQLIRRLLMNRDDTATLLDIYARLDFLYRGGFVKTTMGIPFLKEQADRYQSMFTDAMCAATSRAIEVKDARIALWFARKAMEVDSSREDVYLALIRAQIAAGQRCSAIRTFYKCKEYLNETLGLDPSNEVRKLYDELITIDPSLLKLEPTSFRQ